MKKLLVFISGLLFTLTATSFASNTPETNAPVKAKSACCDCKCGDKCSPNTPCVEGCDCCCAK